MLNIMNRKNIIILILVLGLGFILSNKENPSTTRLSSSWPDAQDDKKINVSEEITEIDTSDWKVFRDEEFGIEFMYPIHLDIEERDGALYILANLPWPQRGTSLIVKETDKTLDQFIYNYNNSDILRDGTSLAIIFEQSDYYIGNIKATLLKGTTAIGIDRGTIFIISDDKHYIIGFSDELIVEESKIISSFKFIN